jgi:hypothetical protein
MFTTGGAKQGEKQPARAMTIERLAAAIAEDREFSKSRPKASRHTTPERRFLL